MFLTKHALQMQFVFVLGGDQLISLLIVFVGSLHYQPFIKLLFWWFSYSSFVTLLPTFWLKYAKLQQEELCPIEHLISMTMPDWIHLVKGSGILLIFVEQKWHQPIFIQQLSQQWEREEESIWNLVLLHCLFSLLLEVWDQLPQFFRINWLLCYQINYIRYIITLFDGFALVEIFLCCNLWQCP